MKFQLDALFAVLGSHHQGSVVKFFVRFSIDMTIGRYIRHYLEISLMLLYTLNLAISGTKVSLFQWTLSYAQCLSFNKYLKGILTISLCISN